MSYKLLSQTQLEFIVDSLQCLVFTKLADISIGRTINTLENEVADLKSSAKIDKFSRISSIAFAGRNLDKIKHNNQFCSLLIEDAERAYIPEIFAPKPKPNDMWTIHMGAVPSQLSNLFSKLLTENHNRLGNAFANINIDTVWYNKSGNFAKAATITVKSMFNLFRITVYKNGRFVITNLMPVTEPGALNVCKEAKRKRFGRALSYIRG
nr:MAG TPA: hypothetical protein [Caudoviricetes sp.]